MSKSSSEKMTKEKLKRVVVRSFVLLVALGGSVFLVSCDKEDRNKDKTRSESAVIKNNPKEGGYPLITKQIPYVNMTVPSDPQKLIFDENAKDVPLSGIKDTVVVFIEGGPTHMVEKEFINKIKEELKSNRFPNHSVVGLRQGHNINPTVFGSGRLLTDANAEEVNDNTLSIVEKTITWLKSNRKVVYLFGHSNGSFVAQNYMARNKLQPDFYIISGTRMKKVQAFFDNYRNNIDFSFTDGITLVTKEVPSNEIPYFNVLSKLQLNHMKNYTTLLDGNPMLSKTVYSLSAKDEALGVVEEDELNFGVKNGALFVSQKEWDHGDAALGIVSALTIFRKRK